MLGDIALVVTAVGVFAAVYALRQSYRERLRQFEAMYVQRYWSLLDQLSLDALSGASSQQVSASDQRAIRAYLFLCEDELEIRESGYISDSTYRVWADGMSEQIKQPMFEAVWKQVCNEQTFPYNYLKLMFDGGQDYDPCKMPLWRRRLRGLAGLKGV